MTINFKIKLVDDYDVDDWKKLMEYYFIQHPDQEGARTMEYDAYVRAAREYKRGRGSASDDFEIKSRDEFALFCQDEFRFVRRSLKNDSKTSHNMWSVSLPALCSPIQSTPTSQTHQEHTSASSHFPRSVSISTFRFVFSDSSARVFDANSAYKQGTKESRALLFRAKK